MQPQMNIMGEYYGELSQPKIKCSYPSFPDFYFSSSLILLFLSKILALIFMPRGISAAILYPKKGVLSVQMSQIDKDYDA